ncbi:MAG: metallophosphoesterase [Pseudomonadota bacterium]
MPTTIAHHPDGATATSVPSEERAISEPAITLAHVSDPHLGAPNADAPDSADGLTIKQRLALASWRRRRRNIFRADVAFRTAADIAAAAPDHVAVTGDLTNAGLHAEFAEAARWLDALGAGAAGDPAGRLSVIPGNHDALALGTWEAGAPALGLGGPTYPWSRRVGRVAIIGLSTARPTLPLLATGRLGRGQIAAVEGLCAEAGAAGLCRVVLVHHPPGETTTWRRALSDRQALGAALSRAGAELVLYGHNHRQERVRFGDARILALGAPAASADPGGGMEPAGWYRIELRGGPGGWTASITLRRLQSGDGFEEIELGTHAL